MKMIDILIHFVIDFFNKKSTATCRNKFTFLTNRSVGNNSGGAIKSEGMSSQQLAVELQKLIIRKFEKHKVYSSRKE